MMQHEKNYVIIGNGIAGTTAAETIRKYDASGRITLLTNEPYPLYNRVSLPRYLQGVLAEQKVMVRDRDWHVQQNIGLLTQTHATSIQVDERIVVTESGRCFPYDALLIATGGQANGLHAPGARECQHIYTFQTLDNTRTLIERMQTAKTAVTYGGSFIAYELCDGFAARHLQTTWIMRSPNFLRSVLDQEGGEVVDAIARSQGVEVIHEDEIVALQSRADGSICIQTKKGREIIADMLGVGLGLALNTHLATEASIEVNRGIVVNAALETNVPGIYAAGDVAEFYDVVLGSYHTMGTWDNALAQGRLVGTNMVGGHATYNDVSTYTSPLFDVNIAVIGNADASSPDVKTISQREPGEKGHENYRKLFFRDNKLIGAVMIGSPKGRKKLVDLVKQQQRVPTTTDQQALLTIK